MEEVRILSHLKPVVNDPGHWKALTTYFEYLIEREHKLLEAAPDQLSIHRGQGRVEILRRLISLRDNINKMDK